VREPKQKLRLAIKLIWYGGCLYGLLVLFARLFGDNLLNIHGFSGLLWLIGILSSLVASVCGVLLGVTLLLLTAEVRSSTNTLFVLLGAFAVGVLAYSTFF
jgi:hypothetical protein